LALTTPEPPTNFNNIFRGRLHTEVITLSAAKSVAANIAEGFTKRSSEKEFKRFLKISIGSSDEVVTHLRTIYFAVPRLQPNMKELAEEYKILSKRLNKLHSIWKSDKS
jgi:four helix bundle protein